jgi:hypothetical protein
MSKLKTSIKQMVNFEVANEIYDAYKEACKKTYTTVRSHLINAMIAFIKQNNSEADRNANPKHNKSV